MPSNVESRAGAPPAMTLPRPAALLATVALSILLSACASGRTVVTLPQPRPPPAPAGPESAGQRAVFISVVTDGRIFENAPNDPSSPSLDGGSASTAGAEIKARAVARKRNGYGMAQGDVVLAEPVTVRQVVKTTLESAFAEAGFRIAEREGSATPVQVRINQYWLWLQPGVMVATIRSRVSVDVTVGTGRPFSVSAETSQPGQIFSEESWANAVSVANAAFQKEAASRIAAESR